MDYSLFLMIEKKIKVTNEKMKKEKNINPHKFISKDGKYIYHVAIIDYLQ